MELSPSSVTLNKGGNFYINGDPPTTAKPNKLWDSLDLHNWGN